MPPLEGVGLPAGLILLWDGEDTPIGFEDVSSDYAGYVRQATEPGNEAVGLGNATHYHRSANTHNVGNDPQGHRDGVLFALPHTHSLELSTSADQAVAEDLESGTYGNTPHSHTGTTGAISYIDGDDYVTTDAANNSPPAIEFRLIRNSSSDQVPSGAMVLAAADIASGFTKLTDEGGASYDRCLKCAQNAIGDETGDYDHTDTLVAHAHGLDNHTHELSGSSIDNATPSTVGPTSATGGSAYATDGTHSHTINSGSYGSGATISQTGSISPFTNINLYPLVKLMLWRADASITAKDNIIGLWDSTVSGAVPDGWAILGGTDPEGGLVFLCSDGDGSYLDASESHSAVGVEHSHTIESHSHTVNIDTYQQPYSGTFGGALGGTVAYHNAATPTGLAGPLTTGNFSETLDLLTSGSNATEPLMPPSIKLLLIQKTGDAASPSASLSPSTSLSPSLSPSLAPDSPSPSFSFSPSQSPSFSPSPSPSLSRSLSPSHSQGIELSPSPSPIPDAPILVSTLFDRLPPSGSLFFVDDYDTQYEVVWQTSQRDGIVYLDFTSITRQPWVWGQPRVGRVENYQVYRIGIITTTRQVLTPTDEGYQVVAEGSSQVVGEIKTTFHCDRQPSDIFRHHLTNSLTAQVDASVSDGSRWVDPDDETGTISCSWPDIAIDGSVLAQSEQPFEWLDIWRADVIRTYS